MLRRGTGKEEEDEDFFKWLDEGGGLHRDLPWCRRKALERKRVLYMNDSERELFAETGGLYGFWPSRKKHNVFCVRKDQKKIIYNMTPNTFEFYDLAKDPSESNNIYDENNSEISDYKEILLNYLKKYDIKNAF